MFNLRNLTLPCPWKWFVFGNICKGASCSGRSGLEGDVFPQRKKLPVGRGVAVLRCCQLRSIRPSHFSSVFHLALLLIPLCTTQPSPLWTLHVNHLSNTFPSKENLHSALMKRVFFSLYPLNEWSADWVILPHSPKSPRHRHQKPGSLTKTFSFTVVGLHPC